MKKVIIVAFVFAIALTVNIAFAGQQGCQNCDHRDNNNSCLCPETSVVNLNGAHVTNNIGANSNTGANGISGIKFGISAMATGSAGAQSIAQTQANWNDISVSTPALGKLTVLNGNWAGVTNNINANANTGNNGISAGCGGASMITGNASAVSSALTIVNTSTIKVDRCCGTPVCGPCGTAN